jgi:hypothetical protein
MIKFFRKIRHKLLSENKFSKYLIYAIGEIILVVIGILIALQINDWNQNQKNKIRENQLLSEMYNELKTDHEVMLWKIDESKTKLNATQSLINVIDQRILYHDSLNSHFSNAVIYTDFMPLVSTYETINNIGFSIIRNDSLRLKIQLLYNSTFKFIPSLDKWRNNYYFSEITSFNIDYFKEFSWFEPSIPLDGQGLLGDYRYYNILKTERTLANQEISVYQDAIDDMEELMTLINSEIIE